MKILLIVVFGLLHLWALFQGVSNLFALPVFYTQQGLSEYTPWWLLVLGIIVPIATFAAALVLGRRRMLSHRVLLLVVSLATANAFALTSGVLAPILLALRAGG